MASISQDSALGSAADAKPLGDQIRALVKPLASLKITVAVFSLSLFLILIGSLAQARSDVWVVVSQYFRCWIAWVEIKDFFPPAFFPSLLDTKWDQLPIQRFPYPGGWLLGLVATVNLAAAHGLRFKVQAKGKRLASGVLIMVLGLVVTWFVVAGGMNADGFETELPSLLQNPAPKVAGEEWNPFTRIWIIFQVTAVLALLAAGWKTMSLSKTLGMKILMATIAIGLCAVVVASEALTPASMRILWQLMKAEFASLLLLWACWLLFKKRSGVVLLHAGVAVLMLSEVLVGLTVSENRFQMWEGDTANFVFDLREREIVVIDNSGAEAKVVSIPEKMIVAAATAEDQAGRTIKDKRLPFDVEVVEFYRNSRLQRVNEGDDNIATAGTGLQLVAENLPIASGMESKSDESTAYVRLREKKSGDIIGTYMLAMRLEDTFEPVLVDGKLYDVAMRFKRTYKPYSVTLLDVEKRDYLGTSTPRDYSSYVRLVDERNNVDREVRIWMNNPLRYRGETLYQTDYFRNEETGAELTSLQVVNNRGWMLPYMACMIVLTGMAVQFGIALTRYLNRRGNVTQTAVGTLTEDAPKSRKGLVWSLVLALVVAGYFGSKFRVPGAKDGEADLYAFGQIPVVKGGRQQPLSSVAMNRMRVLTTGKTMFHRELREAELKEQWESVREDVVAAIPELKPSDLDEFKGGVPELVEWIAAGTEMNEYDVYGMLSKRGFSGNSAITRKTPALWWLLDAISQRKETRRHRVIRIDEPQLLSVLDLQPREGALYSPAEVMEHFDDLESQLEAASKQFADDADRATRFQRRLLKLATNLSRITQTRDVFSILPFDEDRPHSSLMQCLIYKEVLDKMGNVSDSALVLQVPRPGESDEGEWEPLALASIKNGLRKYAEDRDVSTVKGLVSILVDQLPTELVLGELADTIEKLKPGLTDDTTLNKLALRVMGTLEQDDFRLRQLLSVIGSSESDDAAEILKELTPARREKLFELGAANVLLALSDKVSPEAKQATQDLFGSANVNNASITELVRRYTQEVAEKLFTDKDLAAGPGDEVERLAAILNAWETDDVETFNTLVHEHNEAMAKTEVADVKADRTSFEAWFNHAAPSYYCAAMYLIAFAVACLALVVWPQELGRVAFTITLVTFVFHTFALIARIYISGRPPVTNLYSSAVFIGWGAVLLGLIFEFVNKRGIGNLVSTATGTATLVIAYYLGGDGDTFEVLQAVLDTQFWLATHVVCITLGYSATFLAGMFGIVFVAKGFLTQSLGKSDREELSRMIYGTVCFAMLFSFVGTILGGLWADDSWGRFWGWDPKENGAMMIVIWNAIVMHARWDKMVKDRGMAVLAIVGNIVTAWSWFGVNELRAGLHSYGFTEGRLSWLLVFFVSQILVIAIGLFPKPMWGSFGKDGEAKIA